MDDSVVQALAKWPNVPHCYGWLALDRRGRWRMRDDHAQAHRLLGDVIRNPALKGFIDRNYAADDGGAWFFQNGPQRVYVELEATPWILFADRGGWTTHTGARFAGVRRALIDEGGHAYLEGDGGIGLVCDRDLQAFLDALRPCSGALDADGIATALADAPERLELVLEGRAVALERVRASDLPARHGFDPHPATTAARSSTPAAPTRLAAS